jgi:hypothetical protein
LETEGGNLKKEQKDMARIVLKKDVLIINPSDKRRIYHDLEGTLDGYYFFAKTNNSHKVGYASYGINKGSVYELRVWEGGHPVGRDSIKSTKKKWVHVSEDLVADYWNKWDYRSLKKKHKEIVAQIVKQLEVVADRKRKSKTNG